MRTLLTGLAAGLAGTALMTGYQELVGRLRGGGGDGGGEPDWEEAPAPAEVAGRVSEAVVGKRPPAERIPLLASAVHWAYGTGLGVVYALAQRRLGAHPLAHGAVFGTGVWLASYAQLVPLGLYEPPWEYDAKTLATDWSYHLVYGLGVAGAHAALERA